MASLMIFRKKSIPSDSEYGDDVNSYQGAGSTFVSENISEQIADGKYVYNTSVAFKEGSTSLFLNGMYMTLGVDYAELGDDRITFLGDYATLSESIFSEEYTILSIKYVAK